MDTSDVEKILHQIATGDLDPATAASQLARLPFGDLGMARIDHHRSLRQGIPEAVYSPGKTASDVRSIAIELLNSGTGPVIVTRADTAQVAACVEAGEHAGVEPVITTTGGHSCVVFRPAIDRGRSVIIVSAGTADAPVVDECAAVLVALGLAPLVLRDRGVAGLHRLVGDIDTLLEAEAIVVVAGMEGALASVVGGMARGPVIAVPTSVGYGAALEGVTALLAMMASCAAGVSVVGIDNGFGAAMAVARALSTTQ
ncbi:MAG: nickel pincer cofactor biosynthesis protein LarB [Actinomycetes bacterium]